MREWPAGYSVWFEDEAEADGYRLLRSFESDPPREAVNMLLEVSMAVILLLFTMTLILLFRILL